jgi:Fe-S cluster biosynthesis and repair protein YggX
MRSELLKVGRPQHGACEPSVTPHHSERSETAGFQSISIHEVLVSECDMVVSKLWEDWVKIQGIIVNEAREFWSSTNERRICSACDDCMFSCVSLFIAHIIYVLLLDDGELR